MLVVTISKYYVPTEASVSITEQNKLRRFKIQNRSGQPCPAILLRPHAYQSLFHQCSHVGVGGFEVDAQAVGFEGFGGCGAD